MTLLFMMLALIIQTWLPVNCADDEYAALLQTQVNDPYVDYKPEEWEYRFPGASARQGKALKDTPARWFGQDHYECTSSYSFVRANTGAECVNQCKPPGCTQFSFHVADGGCRLGTGSGGKCGVEKEPFGNHPCSGGSREYFTDKMGYTRKKTTSGWSECTVVTYTPYKEQQKDNGWGLVYGGWCTPYWRGDGDLCKEQPNLNACSQKDKYNYLNNCQGDFECVSQLCDNEPACVGFTKRNSDGKFKLKSKIGGIYKSVSAYKCYKSTA